MPLVCWQSVDFPDLLIEEWEEGFGVFHPASGQTLFLDSLAVQILADLHDAPGRFMTDRDLSRMLAARLGMGPDETFADRVSAALCRLDELGLVRKIAEDAP